jgi:hypothetical protein
MNHSAHTQDFYKVVRNNRMLMYSKPKRYFNREEEQGSSFRYLFLVQITTFLIPFFLMSCNCKNKNELDANFIKHLGAPFVKDLTLSPNPPFSITI